MTKTTQPVLDFTEKAVFYKTEPEMRTALYSRINDDLKGELNDFMTEVEGELTSLTPKEAASLFLTILMGSDLSPKAVLLKESLDRSVLVLREVQELSYMLNNLNNGATYKLDLALLKRYGFTRSA